MEQQTHVPFSLKVKPCVFGSINRLHQTHHDEKGRDHHVDTNNEHNDEK